MKILLLLFIFQFSFNSYSKNRCENRYDSYLPRLKLIVKLYRRKHFKKLHQKYRKSFIYSHKRILKVCSKTKNKTILNDIRYGGKFYTSLTSKYKKVLIKYKYAWLLDRKTIKTKKVVIKKIAIRRPKRINPNRLIVHTKASGKGFESLNGIILSNERLYSIAEKDRRPLYFEEKRLIALLRAKDKLFIAPELKIKKKKYNYGDSLKFQEDDVLIIEVN